MSIKYPTILFSIFVFTTTVSLIVYKESVRNSVKNATPDTSLSKRNKGDMRLCMMCHKMVLTDVHVCSAFIDFDFD